MLEACADLLYPTRCGICGLCDEVALCSVCRVQLEHCGLVQNYADEGLDQSLILYRYEGAVRQAVHRLKFERVTSLALPMSELMMKGFDILDIHKIDAIVPVPIHWRRQFSRGFNQSVLLAQAMPLKFVKLDWLKRIRNTPAQAELNRKERLTNLIGAFEATPSVRRKSILLLDDVLTTGATAHECAKALKVAGALSVTALSFSGSGLDD